MRARNEKTDVRKACRILLFSFTGRTALAVHGPRQGGAIPARRQV